MRWRSFREVAQKSTDGVITAEMYHDGCKNRIKTVLSLARHKELFIKLIAALRLPNTGWANNLSIIAKENSNTICPEVHRHHGVVLHFHHMKIWTFFLNLLLHIGSLFTNKMRPMTCCCCFHMIYRNLFSCEPRNTIRHRIRCCEQKKKAQDLNSGHIQRNLNLVPFSEKQGWCTSDRYPEIRVCTRGEALETWEPPSHCFWTGSWKLEEVESWWEFYRNEQTKIWQQQSTFNCRPRITFLGTYYAYVVLTFCELDWEHQRTFPTSVMYTTGTRCNWNIYAQFYLFHSSSTLDSSRLDSKESGQRHRYNELPSHQSLRIESEGQSAQKWTL